MAVAAGVLAVGIAGLAFTILGPASGVVLETEATALTELPSISSTTTQPTPPSTLPATASAELPAATTIPPSTTTHPVPELPPAAVTIIGLNLVGPVRPVGLEDSGAMEVPDVTEVGWYLHGAVPGHPGATVLVAHVWWGDTAGPFHRLGDLDLGAPVEVQLDDGTVHHYTVVERAMYDKYALPSDLWRRSGPETLVLITCGGEFDHDRRRYEENIVVYALPSGHDGLEEVASPLGEQRPWRSAARNGAAFTQSASAALHVPCRHRAIGGRRVPSSILT